MSHTHNMNTHIHTYIYRHTHIKQNLDKIPSTMTMRNACDPSSLQIPVLLHLITNF